MSAAVPYRVPPLREADALHDATEEVIGTLLIHMKPKAERKAKAELLNLAGSLETYRGRQLSGGNVLRLWDRRSPAIIHQAEEEERLRRARLAAALRGMIERHFK
ncbi:MAG: hypothetical protein Q8S53_09610 [Brevundimonas sp.]|uniref:hypothetical protein n=1 Tax=Brevundimonas sp. TaxID=1871086 RepID=UPI002736B0A9|nr:hypothetical protein [Brevundimonas sp.]MDP3378611.1 hypothetical protein [Brevundimonas sp.]